MLAVGLFCSAWRNFNECVCHKFVMCNATGWHGWRESALVHYRNREKVRHFFEGACARGSARPTPVNYGAGPLRL